MKEKTKNLSFFKYASFLVTILILQFNSLTFAQSTVLVDFGSSEAQNVFGLPGWNNLIKSSSVSYTSAGPGGLIPNTGVEEYDDYQGVQGTARDFVLGERIVATWYNNSDDVYRISSRISFTDPDNPNEDGSGGKWYTMRSFDDYRQTYSDIQPHSAQKTVFNITDTGVHKTDGNYSLVNINLTIEWYETAPKPFIVCDKIELYNDADITPPQAPANLISSVLSNSKINLSWDTPSDDVGVVEYLVYNNDEVEGYTRTNSYTASLLDAGTEYNFTVTAFDMIGNESAHSNQVTVSTSPFGTHPSLINPSQFLYLGDFKLPESLSWGSDALTYNPDGDGGQTGTGSGDGYPGSLFISDLNTAERSFVAEINIPMPTQSAAKNIDDLGTAEILQQPVDIRPANIYEREFIDLWRGDLEYLESEKRLYSCWSIYYTVTESKTPALTFCDPSSLSSSQKYGAWYLGGSTEFPNDAMVGDYFFSIPQNWADANTSGRNLVTGRFREGGLSGLGPTLYAVKSMGSSDPPAAGSELPISTLLEYGSVYESDGYNFPNSMDNYNHSDLWRDGDWIDYESSNAVMLIGNKALGQNYYGYIGEKMRHDWVIADLPYPEFGETDPDGKGWKADNFIPMAIFYNPDDLADVTAGTSESYTPQPYAAIRFDKNIFWGPTQEIVSAGYDNINNLLYVTELIASMEGVTIVHVWRVNPAPTGVSESNKLIGSYELEQNYPNPFNPSTTIKFSIPPLRLNSPLSQRSDKGGFTTLKVYDILGREVETLIDELKAPGNYEVKFDGSKYTSGIYFVRMKAGNYVQTIKMSLIK